MVNKHQFCKTTIIHTKVYVKFFNVCLMWWEQDKEREKEGWLCGTAHDGQWRREHVLLHQVAVLLWLRGLSLYSAASAAIITQNKMLWWDMFFAISQPVHCSSPPSRICYELYTGGWLSIRAAYDAKIKEKPFQQFSLINYRNKILHAMWMVLQCRIVYKMVYS
jgi:hypothetical protein